MTDGQKTEKTVEKPKEKKTDFLSGIVEMWKKIIAKFRKKKNSEKKKAKTDGEKKFIVIFVIFLVLAICVAVYFLLFRVTTVEVNGANVYTEEEIISAMGLDIGKTHIYSFNAFTVANRVKQKCPQIEEFTLRRHPPSKLVVTVQEEDACYYAKFYGECRAMSDTLRVLDKIDEETAKENGLIYLLLPTVTKAVEGETVIFAEEYAEQLTNSLLKVLAQADYINSRVTGIDIRDIYDIRIIVDDMYRFELGEKRDFAVSIRVISSTLQNEDFQKYATVKLRVYIDGDKSYYLIPAADMELYE